MAPSEWQFAAELSELRIIGKVDLPAMAYTFAALNNSINATAANDNAAFALEGRGGYDQVCRDWSALRDSLQNLFGGTSTNVQTAADVMLQIVDAYASTDEAAKQSLESAWGNGKTPALQQGETPPPGPAPAIVTK
jgi:hypothetical protein